MTTRTEPDVRFHSLFDAINLRAAADLEIRCYDDAKTFAELRQAIRFENVGGQTATLGATVVAYYAYSLQTRSVKLHRLGVHPRYRRRGIGRHILHRLTGELTRRRPQLIVPVRERNLPAQRFLRAVGLRCCRIAPDHFDGLYGDATEAAFIFKRKLL